MDKVAVLVSIYNEPDDWISQSIGSLVNQSLFDTISLEIIVILDNPERERVGKSDKFILSIAKEYSGCFP